MALINPAMQFNSWLTSFVGSSGFTSLSPESQAALMSAAQGNQGTIPQGQPFQAAMNEAKAKGFVPEMTWKDWLAVAGMVAGGVAAPFAIGALGAGGAAATGAEAAAGVEAGAVAGITPELAGGLGTGAVAGPGIAGVEGLGGGILPQVADAAKKVQPILGGMAKAGADANANRDRIMPSAESVKLARDKYALEAPSTRMTQSSKASILKGLQPAKTTWAGPGSGARGEMPTFSGGIPNAVSGMDPRAKELADGILTKNLQDQLAGKDAETPYLDKIGTTSATDKAVGAGAIGASIFDTFEDDILRWF